MKKLVRHALVTAAVIGVAVAGVPSAAFAAGNSNTCNGANICGVGATGFPGGTISVDADTSGAGTGSWTLFGPNNFRCSKRFPASGGVRSWTCPGAPAGNYNATVSPGEPLQVLKIGIRW